MKNADTPHSPPIIAALKDFDYDSGSLLERLLFNHRPIILVLCAITTICLGFAATKVQLSGDYLQSMPAQQPYIVNYLNHFDDLSTQSNAVQIVVAANHGTILNAHFLELLRQINDKVYLLPGVNRPFMKSLWTANTQWQQVTAQGLVGGRLIDQDYDGSPKAVKEVALHIQDGQVLGDLVEPGYGSTLIYVPLLLKTGNTPLDYGLLARNFDEIAAEYSSQGVTLHTIGFALVLGDMINHIYKIIFFFLISIAISAIALFLYTRCLRSAFLVVTASLTAVVWQLGALVLLGLRLTPYSMLVPFLVFAIGMSHGAQKMNGVVQDIARGNDKLVAARYTFRRLFLAGLAALVCDAASFAVLLVIRITAIEQLAAIATIGVSFLIITNLILIPVLLSYIGVSQKAAQRSIEALTSPAQTRHPILTILVRFTHRGVAAGALFAALAFTVFGYTVGRHAQIGNLQPGAPELRQSSQYNRDDAFFGRHYPGRRDQLIVLVDTTPGLCLDYPVLSVMDRLQWQVQQMPQVVFSQSVASAESYAMSGLWEGSPKWYGIEPDDALLSQVQLGIPRKLINFTCYFDPIYISLINHKAGTLETVVKALQKFINDPENQGPGFKLSLIAGDAGIDAATNIVVAQANAIMLGLVYLVVILFCFIAFRSWRAVLCAVIPLILTSVLAQALMVWLQIGIKVATLPVLALGVGIGVDYALYVLSILLRFMREGMTLPEAYYQTLLSTGKVVLFTGFTLAVGVATWILAPLKFQADMGLLLAFMFLWNMLGAMILIPSLAAFLLPDRLFDRT